MPADSASADPPSNLILATQHFAVSRERLQHAIEHAAHLLPSQGPISVFVHHNTLHAFEDLPFQQAVLEGLRLYGCEPYLSEEEFRRLFEQGRLRVEDLQAVLMDDLGELGGIFVASFGTRYSLRLAMLQFPIKIAPDVELQWLIAETDALDRFRPEVEPAVRDHMVIETKHWVMRDLRANGNGTEVLARHLLDELCEDLGRHRVESWSEQQWESFFLRFLWRVCLHGVRSVQSSSPHEGASLSTLPGTRSPAPRESGASGFQRLRDGILSETGIDPDRLVNDVLIRFCAAYLDQGFADWDVPAREDGLLRSFATLYSCRKAIAPPWMKGLREEMQEVLDEGIDAWQLIQRNMDRLSVPAEAVDDFVLQSLLALRGWAGLMWQMETNAPWTPRPAPPGSLVEYLAVRLTLERYALQWMARQYFHERDLSALRERFARTYRPSTPEHGTELQQAFTVFQLAQVRGWSPEDLVHLAPEQWRQLLQEINSFDGLERRRVFQLAYERKYRNEILDGIINHNRVEGDGPAAPRTPGRPAYQVVCCIDDREESFRRHLEEVDPECETFGAAGFYAVAMYYRGATEAHFRPLCPIVITPDHYVQEEPMFSAVDVSQRRSQRRQLLGRITHYLHSRSRTLLGGALTGVLGSLATFPLVARILAPRLTARMRELFGSFVNPPATELRIERFTPEPGPDEDAQGYTVEEMAQIVQRTLQDIGLVRDFSPLILFVGHGSSSMNNPHESAYNCGACSGGRGGPNARAFAAMANDPRVRRLVQQAGIEIPEDVRFLGAYHNTCNDEVEYFDLDLLPRTHRALFRRMERSIHDARARNAHERCRRFESAPLDLGYAEALQHVEQRAEDLSQARPEYNHATDALCFVGRREWSRGLYLDRRAFLTSYDPGIDDEEATILTRILSAAIPVCAGINLEYYFSTVDNEGYGCGSKLPHNLAGLAGVMTGAGSDSRPGLSAQMVEIHEPMRILFVIETSPETMTRIMEKLPNIGRLVRNRWVQLALYDAQRNEIQLYGQDGFARYRPESHRLPQVASSVEWYRGWRDHLAPASVIPPRSV
ncbi:MAG: UPF0753 protein [Pirellulaceae bacterium]|nr:MAG: UPF0753 protein [Pirellulaceae bacterium]